MQFEWIPSYTVSVAPGLDAHRVHPGLWQGSVPPTGSAVRKAGFDALILCCLDSEYRHLYGTVPSPALFPGVQIHRCQLDDAAPTTDELKRARRAADFAARVVKMRGRVLCTCHQGRNRSGLVSALAIYRLTGVSGRRCVDQVRRARPGALTNENFVQELERLP